ncbi:MAG: M56 family metallopeptidase [Gammaproteobacteria bacterium]|nr:M56 family metallopeptidase [Gammaproteobacteria bacterium]
MLADTLAWTLIHFLWQGVLIAALLLLALWLAPQDDDVARSNHRYGAAMLALALLLLAPVLTFAWQWLGDGSSAAIAAGSTGFAVQAAIDSVTGWQLPPLMLRSLLALWAAGVSWYAMKMLLAWIALQYLQRTQVHATPAWLASQVATLVEQMSISRPVRIIVSGVIHTPMTTGWLRPVILLPAALLTSMQMDQLRLLLAHELAHIRRHDYLVNMVQNIVRILFFYHPLVHWVCSILDEERELCCDHIAMACAGDRLQYAKALLSLQDQPHPLPALAAASTCKHALLRRIQRILGEPEVDSPHDLRQRPLLCLTSLLVSMAVFISGFSSIEHSRAAMHVLPEQAQELLLTPSQQQARHLLDELYLRAARFEYPPRSASDQPRHIADGWSATASQQAPVSGYPIDLQTASTPQHQELDAAPGEVMPSLDSLHQQHLQRQQLVRELDRHTFRGDAGRADAASVNFTQASFNDISAHVEQLSTALNTDNYSLRADTLPEPVYQVSPQLPSRLYDDDAIVIVNLIYSIDAAGKPVDILVAADSDDVRAFVNAAENALRQWQYPPVSKQLQQMRIKQQFVFMQTTSASRCVTGSRICARDNYAVEQVYINTGSG